MGLEEKIKKIEKCSDNERRKILGEFIRALEQGKIRAAQKEGDQWEVNKWVKKGILACFRYGDIKCDQFTKDIDLLWRREISDIPARFVCGGTFLRRGTYIGKGVVCMPPSFINVGAYIDDDTMIDSNVTIGSCAQIGKKVHIGAGTVIGGVLEPPQAMPVIIEDEVFIGAGCRILEGILVEKRAAIAAGTTIVANMEIIDLVNDKVYYKRIPPEAVVIPGMRRYRDTPYYTLVLLIPKYKDEKTDAKTAIEEALREFKSFESF